MSANIKIDKEWSKIIKEIAEREGFGDFDVEFNSGSLKGDGFLGIITTVLIKDKNSNKTLNLILKSAHSDPNIRSEMPIRCVYEREIYMYEKVFPELFRFQKEKGILNEFSAVPKLYGTCVTENIEVVLMEDLKKIGYEMWDKRLQMKSEPISLVFSEYAKFHSISLAMRYLQPDRFRKLTENLNDIFANMLESKFELTVEGPIESAISAIEDNTVIKTILQKFSNGIKTFLLEDLRNKDDHLVLLHGDCWCNNMLFKYEDIDPTKPTKVCLLDWQLSRPGSPVMDLSYFFYVCSSTETLYEYKRFLRIYHDIVSENLKNFGCNPDEILPYSLLETHWKKYSQFGLFAAIMLFRVLVSDRDEIKDLTDFAKEGDKIFKEVFTQRNKGEYARRLSDLVVFMSENNLI